MYLKQTALTVLLHAGKKGKAIPVTGRGGPYVCETSRLPHFVDSRLTDGGNVIAACTIGKTLQDLTLTRRRRFIRCHNKSHSIITKVYECEW
jgi:hypothetical protein